jgi:dUTP pyrophosphatase
MQSNPTFQKIKYLLNIKVGDKYKEYYETFNSHHNGDSGIDLYNATSNITKPFDVTTVDFNIQCEMIDLETNEYSSYLLVPRSSLSSTCFQLANSVGIIDAGYRGNIKAKVRNCHMTDAEFPTGSWFQIVAPDLKPIRVCVVTSLSSTTRDDGGFGSTK